MREKWATSLGHQKISMLNSCPPAFFLTSQNLDLIEIKSKREKERVEKKKKGSSSLLDDLVQIPSDLCERVRTAIFFFEI